MDKMSEKILNALWAIDVYKHPEDYVENYSASGMTDEGKTTVRVGTLRRRVFDEKIFMLRIEREGERPQDLVFFDRAEFNKEAKKIVDEFKQKEEKSKAKFQAWQDEQRRKWEKEFLGKPAKIEKATDWGPLWIKLDRGELVWARPEIVGLRLPCGHIAEISHHDDILKEGATRLFMRMHASSHDSDFLIDSPLAQKALSLSCPERDLTHAPSDINCTLTIDLPETAKKIIGERRAKAMGE